MVKLPSNFLQTIQNLNDFLVFSTITIAISSITMLTGARISNPHTNDPTPNSAASSKTPCRMPTPGMSLSSKRYSYLIFLPRKPTKLYYQAVSDSYTISNSENHYVYERFDIWARLAPVLQTNSYSRGCRLRTKVRALETTCKRHFANPNQIQNC